MNLFRSTAAVLALTTGLLTMPAQAEMDAQTQSSSAQANVSGNQIYDTDAPDAFAMIGDLFIARPLLICTTVIGAGVFVVTLPFSAMGGGIGAAGRALVVEPGQAAFVRCLGCTGVGYNKRQ